MRIVVATTGLAIACASCPSAPTFLDAAAPTGTCFDYDAQDISLTGTVFSRIYFGPPGYGETPAKDAREQPFLLLLDAPICVGAQGRPPYADSQSNIIVVQLAAIHVDVDLLKKTMGQHLTVKGALFGQITAHHRTPVLLDVLGINAS